MKEQIGKRIRERRKELGITQDKLATMCNVSRERISFIENGKCNDILVSTLTAIASALGTTIEFFLN